MSRYLPDNTTTTPRKQVAFKYSDGNSIELGDSFQSTAGRRYTVIDFLKLERSVPTLAIFVEDNGYLVIIWLSEKTALVARAPAPGQQPTAELIAKGAEQGNANAAYHLAWLYLEGDGIAQDAEMAATLFHQAAQRGHPAAAYSLADILSVSHSAEAVKWYTFAARLGYRYAMFALARRYKSGQDVAQDETTAFYWSVHGEGLYDLGVDWDAGLNARIELVRQAPGACDAQDYYARALAVVDNVGRMVDGVKPLKNFSLAVEMMETAAATGYIAAQFKLGELYLQGYVVRRDTETALRFFHAAADQGDAGALARLGQLHYNGSLGEKNIPLALKYYQQAAEMGNATAQAFMGIEYHTGQDVAQDLRKALAYYQLAARQGDRNALHNLGTMYDTGTGVQKDSARAFEHYKRAADLGDGSSQYSTGWKYHAGEGCEKDLALAQGYYLKAANNNHALGQFQTGWMYEHGVGVLQNPAQALYWYSRAAYHDNPDAHYRMGLLYKAGRGTREDVRKAWASFQNAVALGHEKAKRELANLPPPVPFDPVRHESGNLRDLYDAVASCEGKNIWEDVIQPQLPALTKARRYFEEMKKRPCTRKPWPELLPGENLNLYCASRLSDILLLSFQNRQESGNNWPSVTLEDYANLFSHLGFDISHPARFHPFSCEIVEVEESKGAAIELSEVVWPCVMLGNMMFARAGVRIRAPRYLAAKGVADASDLYWCYRRDYRRAHDLSHGWGHNSQWNTDFRRDFDLGNRYAYNVDKYSEQTDLRVVVNNNKAPQHMDGMPLQNRITLLKNRCVTSAAYTGKIHSDYFPYHDYFEEPKGS